MKHCKNCKKDFSNDKSYCDSCGKKLVEMYHKKHKKGDSSTYSVSSLLKSVPFFVFLILFGIGAGILLPTKVESYKVEMPYTEKEQYTVEVPYEDVEEYTAQVPYVVQEQHVESIPVTEQEPYQDTECAFLGLFCKGVTKYRTVTNYKDVVKTEDITKYRDETRYRKVTKTRTEVREKEVVKTRMETRYKEVNWIFGFDAVINFRDLSKYG